MRVAITGGTGLVGGHFAAALSAGGHQVVVVARGVDQRPWAQEVLALPRVSQACVSIDDEVALARAFEGCEAVAHCAGINREIGTQTYQAVHVDGTTHVVQAAEKAGVKRLALVSFLRARPDCGSLYHESKWEAEEIVRRSNLEWTVLKPGMMFGRGDHMLDHLSKALRTFPVYLGVGDRRVRPLAVQDAVKVLVAALVDDRLTRQTVPLMGPTEIGFDDAARLLARVIGKRRFFLRAPIAFHYLLARIAEATMTVPLIATAQARILEEELIESTRAPDPIPEDLVPMTPFDEESIRAGLPEAARFKLSDLRFFANRRSSPSRGVIVCGEGTAIIHRDPKDVLEFVLDVDQYRRADLKIGRVRWVQRDGSRGRVRHGGRFLGLPAPSVTLSFDLVPYSRLDFKGEDVPWPLRGFEGDFTCEEITEGTRVTHRECFILGPLIGPVFRSVFGGWISRDTPAEVLRMKRLLDDGFDAAR
jgi:uncharacterized protein YbjT (DUF2867 family)